MKKIFCLLILCLCVRDLPVIKMSSIWGSKGSKPKANGVPCDPPRGPGIHIYLFWTKEGERYLSHTSEEVTAEELCIRAAKAIGEPRAKPNHADLNQGTLCVCVCVFVPCLLVALCLTSLFIPQG